MPKTTTSIKNVTVYIHIPTVTVKHLSNKNQLLYEVIQITL